MRILMATATVLLVAASPAIAQSPPTGAAYLELCAQHGIQPQDCHRGPVAHPIFHMDHCLAQGIPQWRCNLIDYCFKKNDPAAAGGECARGYLAGLPPQPPSPDPARIKRAQEYYAKILRGEKSELPHPPP